MNKTSIIATYMALLLAAELAFAASTDVKGMRIRPSPEKTRIVFDLPGPADHNIFTLSGPRRLVIDISKVSLKVDTDALKLEGTPITGIRHAKRNKHDLRVVMDLKEAVSRNSFLLKPIEPHGHRLVIDLKTTVQKIEPVVQKADLVSRQMRDVVVAIDAGHGGDDPGAVGVNELLEKDVVFQVARRLARLFNKEPGFKAKMVREGDYYVDLKKRTTIAKRSSADAFLSIHADAYRTAAASGASVYAISDEATSETASWLAERENRADLIGGTSLNDMDEDDLLREVVSELVMDKSLEGSLEMGEQVLKRLGGVTKLHKRQVEQAAFAVLKSDMSSLLIEMGFISNPGEARKLRAKAYQSKLAQAIFAGVRDYLTQKPPPGSWLAWVRKGGNGSNRLTHVVAPGDTLSEIALKYRVSSTSIKIMNGLRNDTIIAGSILKIPTS